MPGKDFSHTDYLLIYVAHAQETLAGEFHVAPSSRDLILLFFVVYLLQFSFLCLVGGMSMFRGIYTLMVHFVQWPLSYILGLMNNKKKAIGGGKTEGAALNNSVTGAVGLWKGFDLQSHLIRDNVRSGYFVSGSCCRSEAEGLGKRWRNQRTEILSLEPRVFMYRNFLSKEESQYLIRHGTPYMTRSGVLDTRTGKSYHSSSRTSTGMFMRRGQDKIIGDIEKGIADFTFIPVEHGEGLQVLRYEVGQKNLPHYDTNTSVDGPITKNGGPRIATVLMYLSDVEEGGETVFPSAKGDAMSKHGKKGITVKPKMGDALLFWSIKPDGTLDPSSLHGGDPVIKGTKWACTKWLHAKEYKV